MSTLYIIRGLPGAGKSYFSKHAFNCMVVEADMFCMQNNEYNFSRDKLAERFNSCEETVKIALKIGADCAIVNTFVLKKYIDKYIEIAEQYNAKYFIYTILPSGRNSVHNVPEETIKKMKEQWEDIPGEIFYESSGGCLGTKSGVSYYEIHESLNDHKKKIRNILDSIADNLNIRAIDHDESKFSPEELPIFLEAWPLLKEGKKDYLGDIYKKALEKLGPALQHHYKENDHHPEHFANGISDMSIMQLLEMLCDWYVSSGLYDTKNTEEDIKNKMIKSMERFSIKEPLSNILLTTLYGIDKLKGT